MHSGWDSSNTAHLLEIPIDYGLKGYHVNIAGCIRPDNSIEHRDVEGNIVVSENFLPLDRPARIGVTSGASTPDSVVQECLEQIVLLKKLFEVSEPAVWEPVGGSTGPHRMAGRWPPPKA